MAVCHGVVVRLEVVGRILPFASKHLAKASECAGERYQGYNAHQRVSQWFHLKHMRYYSSESEQADKAQCPISTPDYVYVYNGPLAVTVTRLKVKGKPAASNSAPRVNKHFM